MAITLDGSNGITTPGGATTDDITFADNDKAIFGAGSDLQIYHDGGNSYIADVGTGQLNVQGTNLYLKNGSGSEVYALFQEGANNTYFYYNGSQKLAVTNTGVDVTGTVTADGLTVDGTPVRFNSTAPMLNFMETGVADSNHRIRQNAGNFYIQKLSDDEGTATDRLIIDGGTGNVGINGLPNSGRKLHIEDNDASVGITLKDTGGHQMGIFSDNNNLQFKSDTSGNLFVQMYGANGSKDFGSFESFSGGYNIIAGAGSASSYALRLDAPGTGAGNILQVVNGFGQIGSISVSGASTSFNTSSDYRLKTDVQPMTGATARVQALNPVNFEWIADGNRTDGFLAHEAQEVVPEAVVGVKDAMKDEPYEVTPAVEATYDEEGNELTAAVEAVMGTRTVPSHQSIDQSKLVPLLTAALQEALTEIASLKTRVEALEA